MRVQSSTLHNPGVVLPEYLKTEAGGQEFKVTLDYVEVEILPKRRVEATATATSENTYS